MCHLCDAGYVGYTRGHLHVRVDGHKQRSSSTKKHNQDKHDKVPEDLLRRFDLLKKCKNNSIAQCTWCYYSSENWNQPWTCNPTQSLLKYFCNLITDALSCRFIAAINTRRIHHLNIYQKRLQSVGSYRYFLRIYVLLNLYWSNGATAEYPAIHLHVTE